MDRILVAQAYSGVGVCRLTRRQGRPVKTRPGLVFSRFTVALSRAGHVVDIYDVGGAFWYGCDDPKARWGGRTQYRRQRVGSREVGRFPPFILAVGIGVQPRREGMDRQRGWPNLGMVLFLVSGRRGVPDLMSAKTICGVLCTA